MSPTSEVRWATPRELCGVVRYEWSVRHAWTSRRAALRGLWSTFARRYAYETCTCGRRVAAGIGETYWRAPDDLWQRVIGSPHGVLCPSCFTERAAAKGIRVYWTPREIAADPEEVNQVDWDKWHLDLRLNHGRKIPDPPKLVGPKGSFQFWDGSKWKLVIPGPQHDAR